MWSLLALVRRTYREILRVATAGSAHKLQQVEIKLQAFKVYLSFAKCLSICSRIRLAKKAPSSIASGMLNAINSVATSFYNPAGGATECNGDLRGNRICILCPNNERATLALANSPSIQGVRFHNKSIVEVTPYFPPRAAVEDSSRR